MGTFDTVRVHCPQCGAALEFQSKSGDCDLKLYSIGEAPAEISQGVEPAQTCAGCGYVIRLLGRVVSVEPPTPERFGGEQIAARIRYGDVLVLRERIRPMTRDEYEKKVASLREAGATLGIKILLLDFYTNVETVMRPVTKIKPESI